ncbi:MAG: hypothetical protein QOD52_996 [Gaiellaceae bacterium]|jgi:predicted ribosomally synthesized peptide with SipW-like signal peptide|nr:hypothetical protein [Gaiellaceae bacterium]
MSRTKTKRYLMLLAAVGLIAAGLGGTGTFASFTAQTTNADNSFTTGTLLLSNKVTTVTSTACLSNTPGATNANGGCDIVVSGTKLFPGASPISGTVILKNVGSIDASVLNLTTAGCAPDASQAPFTSSADLCASVFMYVQETTSDGAGPSHCWFGVGAGTTTCSTTFAGATSADDSLNAFHTAFATAALGDLSTPSPLSTALPSDGSRYFKIGLYLKGTGSAAGDNNFQGLSASFPLTWHIES